MTVAALAVAVVVPLALAAVALGLWVRARRTRRQTVEALAAVPVVAGMAGAEVRVQAPALASAVARRLGLDAREAGVVADAVRLRPLADIVAAPSDGSLVVARSMAEVTTESAIDRRTESVLDEALTAPRGRSGRTAAIVRVVDTYSRRLAATPDTPSGALFATVATHHSGYERRAAEELLHLVQGRPPSA